MMAAGDALDAVPLLDLAAPKPFSRNAPASLSVDQPACRRAVAVSGNFYFVLFLGEGTEQRRLTSLSSVFSNQDF